MKIIWLKFLMLIMLFPSCTTNVLDESENDLREQKVLAVKKYDNDFNNNFDFLLATRSCLVESSEEEIDSVMIELDKQVCGEIILPSSELLVQFGLTDEVFIEAINELGETQIPLIELKCFTAMGILECFRNEGVIVTRADYLDVVGCVGIGMATKDLLNLPAKQIAKLTIKKFVARAIPYVGLGWGIASAAHCLSKL